MDCLMPLAPMVPALLLVLVHVRPAVQQYALQQED
jgi:hypothetical protein